MLVLVHFIQGHYDVGRFYSGRILRWEQRTTEICVQRPGTLGGPGCKAEAEVKMDTVREAFCA